jgi:hypothetical protein
MNVSPTLDTNQDPTPGFGWPPTFSARDCLKRPAIRAISRDTSSTQGVLALAAWTEPRVISEFWRHNQ